MSRRKVVAALPYGGSGAERRKAILNFSRLKYIVENRCQVVPNGPRTTEELVAYDVDVARTPMDEIPRNALKKIYNADILIVLLSGRNFTVAYELGYRRARESAPPILIVDSKDDLPVYESAVAYQSWQQDDVLRQIDRIAGDDYPPLDDFQVDIPDALKAAIDAKDGQLIMGLQLALQQIENNFELPSPDPVQKLRGVLSESITRFYPFSVVEVRFSKPGEFEDPPTIVVDFDNDFSRFFGYVSKAAAQKDAPLTLDRLLHRLKKYLDPDDWEKFSEEQNKLTESLIKNFEPAHARVPIRINSSHPYGQFKCKSFLPCMTAYATDADGTWDGPYRMYLLIAYISID